MLGRTVEFIYEIFSDHWVLIRNSSHPDPVDLIRNKEFCMWIRNPVWKPRPLLYNNAS